ncbi:recombinase family protein [Lachnospiraceae bacterium 64-25]
MSEKYCAYLRKSRADRDAELRGEEETLARHKRILTELSEKMHKPISKFYSEVVSGETISDRPVMQELLADVESDMWTGVFVVEVERLARGNTRDQGIVADAFKYSNTVIITPIKTYNPSNEFDEEYFEFGLFMSRREYKTINRRLQRGRIASVKEGNFIGGTAPYGYKKVKLSKGYSLEPIPEQAEAVKQIFEWYCHGEQQSDGSIQQLGTYSIAAKLDQLGVKPPSKDKWTKSTVQDILKNITYTGKVSFGRYKDVKTTVNGNVVKKRVYDPNHTIAQGKHQAIITDDLFQMAIQRRHERRRNTTPSSLTLQNPLSGMVYCQKCGALMTRLGPNSKNRYATLKCPNRYCDNVSSPLYLVERQVLQYLRDWLHAYKLDHKIIDFAPAKTEISAKQNMINKIDRDISLINSQLNRAYDLLEQEVYTIEIFKERQMNLKSSIITLEGQKEKAIQDLSHLQKLLDEQNSFAPKVERLLDSYDENDVETNNAILKELIDHILYEKNERNTRGKVDNCNFSLHIYPRISF